MTSQDSGVVVRAGRGYAVVLTRDGRFLRVKSRGIPPMVGEEILLPSPFAPWTSWTRWVPAVALACVMVFLSFFGYTKYIEARPALAYVSVDSSGSVELEVNDRGLVRSATAFNQEGERLLTQIRYQFQPVDKVITEIAKIESEKGSSGFIVGFIPIKETPQVTKLEARIREQVRKAAPNFRLPPAQAGQGTGGESGVTNPLVNTFRFTIETREKARTMSMSPARLLVWGLSAKSRGAQIEPSGPGPAGTNGSSGNKDQPGKPGDSTGPGKPGPDTGSNQPGDSVTPGMTSLLSEEQVRAGLPDVSNPSDFLKVLKEHDDPQELEDVVEEILNMFQKAGEESGRGDGGAEAGANETTPGKTDKGNGAGQDNRRKEGGSKGGEQPEGGGNGGNGGRGGQGRKSGDRGREGHGGTSEGAGKGEDGGKSGTAGNDETSGKTKPSGSTPPGDDGHEQKSSDDEPGDR
ncbi:MAG TPA: anti-sigma factor domain-containing protein [Firmicutes bacterium]|nr:anti-sigma factor domain-containing protein [Candidatus Fermentithermobacillaceae bacterium]